MLDHNGACHFGSSFALGSLNPICVKNPPTHTKVGGHGGQTTGGGPSGVQGGRGKVAQATGGHPGGKGNLLGHLLQAVRVAANLVRGGNQGDHPAGQTGPTKAVLEVLCDRRQLEDAYVATYGPPKPRLEFQGSDGYLKKQWRMIGKGELGYIPAKNIVSALPKEGERPSSTHKKIMVDGWEREDEEEVRSHPTSRRQLERLHLPSLLTCTAALPQFGNLKVTKEELDDWYAWFYGEDIAGRKPPPSDTTLLFAERNAWRKIHEMVHQGTTLSNALKNIRGDFLFWQREVYEHLNQAPEKEEQGQGTQGVADSVGEAQEGGERFLALEADPVQAEGQGRQGEVPQHPLGSMAGPLGFQESQRGGVLQRSSPPQQVFGIMRPIPQLPGQEGWVGVRCPPIEACATGMPSPSQVTGGHSGCHRPRGFLVSVGTTGRQCESTQRGRANPTKATTKHQSRERTHPGHPRRAEASLSPAPEDPPGKGVPRAGRTARASSKPEDR